MRFIRDIINEKTQAASNGESSALRYPLRLRDEDRTDLSHEADPLKASLETVSSEASLDLQNEIANSASLGSHAHEDGSDTDTDIDLSAITDALVVEPTPPVPSFGAKIEASEHTDSAEELPQDAFSTQPHHSGLHAKPENQTPKKIQDLSESDAFDWAEPTPDDGHQAIPETKASSARHSAQNFLETERIAINQSQSQGTGARSEMALQEDSRIVTNLSENQSQSAQPNVATEEFSKAPKHVPNAEIAPLGSSVAAHRPAAGNTSKGRVKTRLLGFGGPQSMVSDPIKQTQQAATAVQAQFPVGWLVVVDGPGKGASFALFDGLTQIGRGEGQTVRLDFGDNTISRENHAAIAYDGEQREFFFGHGGKANLVRLNNRPVLSTENLTTNSVIRIGETTLRFVALCGEDFTWSEIEAKESDHAQFG